MEVSERNKTIPTSILLTRRSACVRHSCGHHSSGVLSHFERRAGHRKSIVWTSDRPALVFSTSRELRYAKTYCWFIPSDSEIVLQRFYRENIQSRVKYRLWKFLYLNKSKTKKWIPNCLTTLRGGFGNWLLKIIREPISFFLIQCEDIFF